MDRGLFITFEGIDGCGKTTQLNLLANYLKENGFEVVVTREPGCKGIGEKIRSLLLNSKDDVSSNCEAFLFLADRAQNIDNIVKPAVERGAIVLCDRHTDSTIAYQGYGRGIDINHLKKLNTLATGDFLPDLTLVFDIDVETSQKRVGEVKDRMESIGVDFTRKVRNGYLDIAINEPNRVKVINSKDSIENIFEQVKSLIKTKLG
ncbi:MAG: dTMP kinase [bacterium]|nr:dTMP kinase [bacterium]